MNILTPFGKIVVRCTFYGLILTTVTSTVTVVYMQYIYNKKIDIVDTVLRKINLQHIQQYEPPKHTVNKPKNIMTAVINHKPNNIDIYSPTYVITDSVKNAIYSYESNFNTTVFSPSRKHSGLCQMSDAALTDVFYKKNHFAFAKEDYKTQDMYCTRRFNYILNLLVKKHITPNIMNIYTVHQLGYKGGINFIKKHKINKTHIVSNVNKKNLIDAWIKQTEFNLNKGLNKIRKE